MSKSKKTRVRKVSEDQPIIRFSKHIPKDLQDEMIKNIQHIQFRPQLEDVIRKDE